MKILYVLNSKNPGGMEQHVLDLVNQMVLRGHEVYVWCAGGVIYDWYARSGAKVLEKEIRNDIDISYIKALADFVKRESINVIHAHEIKAVANSLIGGFLGGAKVRITHQHTPFVDWQVSKSKKLIYDAFYALLVNLLSTREIALTESIKKVKLQAGIKKDKIVVIPNGIDVYKFYVLETERQRYRKEVRKKYRIGEEVKIIGNVSRTTKEKGHDLLIKAFGKLINDKQLDRNLFMLMICGGGELEESLWSLAEELNIKDRVIITGRFDEDMKIKFYSSFDYFVFPSLAEGFGIVLIEALICGLPVLCSDLEVLKEVGKQFPTYFKTGDVEDLSDKILDLVDKQIDVESQRKYIEHNYSLDKFGENYDHLYSMLVNLGASTKFLPKNL